MGRHIFTCQRGRARLECSLNRCSCDGCGGRRGTACRELRQAGPRPAAVSAPEAMIKTVGAALDGFGDLPEEDREMLFETFRLWLDNDASVRGTAEVLVCHPNTVRHRLRRIEKHTGRSLSRPRDVAELCLTFEVHHRLMEPKPTDPWTSRRAATRRSQHPQARVPRHHHRCGPEI
jgi:PucR C-terminal helix-turn-helix domain